MPEGDTIHKTASALDRALSGKTIRSFAAPRVRRDLWPSPGTRIDRVEAMGKNVLMRFGDGRTLVTHMMMTGSWHVYRPGDRWRRDPGSARASIEVADAVAVCFAAPVVEIHTDHTMHDDPRLARLGPDLASPDADLDNAVARLRSLPERGTSVAEALLDQRIANGIGNVLKSETLFVCRVDPFVPARALDDARARSLISAAATLLRRNLGPGPRSTIDGRLAVYGRTGKPCMRCGTRIAARKHGRPSRATYWCPACQPAEAVGA